MAKYTLTDVMYFWSGLMLGVSTALLLFLPRQGPLEGPEAAEAGLEHLNSGSMELEAAAAARDGLMEYESVEREEGKFLDDDESMLAQDLIQRVRLLIWVKTSPQTISKHAKAIRETWGKRVDRIVYFSSAPNESFPAIGLEVPDNPGGDTGLILEGFRYVYRNYLDEADWFMQVDDDTFVIVENLLYFLSEEDDQEPVYYGFLPDHQSPVGRFSCVGGAYLLSREALERFGENETTCQPRKGNTNERSMNFTQCMQTLGIQLSPTADALGRSRFHCMEAEVYLQGANKTHFRRPYFDPALAEKRMRNLSDYSITFHGLKPSSMEWMYYYVYQLAPYGVRFKPQRLNTGSP